MAKKKGKQATSEVPDGATSTAAETPPAGGESIQGYFRQVFKESPRLLKERSNEELYRRWLADHPGHDEVPDRVKQGLQNLKSMLRKKLGKRGRPKKAEQPEQPATPGPKPQAQPAPEPNVLEQLEVLIDDTLALAKNLDRRGLDEVIRHLRTARNLVVWKGGKP